MSTTVTKPSGARNLYKRFMHPEQAEITEVDLAEDRYDLSTEMSLCRQYLATLLQIQKELMTKHPDKRELILAVQQQQTEGAFNLAKVMKFSREIENSGEVFTNDRVAGLVDKIAALVMYRVTSCEERQQLLEDIGDLTTAFRRSTLQGTLVTPDQDARIMDGTVPQYDEDENDDNNDRSGTLHNLDRVDRITGPIADDNAVTIDITTAR